MNKTDKAFAFMALEGTFVAPQRMPLAEVLIGAGPLRVRPSEQAQWKSQLLNTKLQHMSKQLPQILLENSDLFH